MKLAAAFRVILAAVVFAISALAVFRAPTHFLWMLSVVITELGHLFAIVTLVIAVPLWRYGTSGRTAALLCIAAGILLLTPVLRAIPVARRLPAKLAEAFGNAATSRQAPVASLDLFRGLTVPEIEPETHVYKTTNGETLSFDLYRAAGSAQVAAPVLIDIHGGSWNSGDNKDFVPMNRYLAGRGFAVASVIYRLAPRWPYPAASEDVRSAIAFLRDHSDKFRIDPNRIVLLGRSAGGQIALDVAYGSHDPGIRGVIGFYSPIVLDWAWDHPANPLVIDTRGSLKGYLGGSPSEVPARFAAASPDRAAFSSGVPTLLLHGGRDELVSDYHSVQLDKRLSDARVPHLYVHLSWATHGFDYFLRGPGGQISTYAIEHFLDRVMRQ